MAQIRPDVAARGYADGIAVGLAPAIWSFWQGEPDGNAVGIAPGIIFFEFWFLARYLAGYFTGRQYNKTNIQMHHVITHLYA
jgi:hypothetical protein